MATEFRLPPLGDGVDEGVVVKVLVEAGQAVAREQPVLEVETNKAIAEVPSGVSGVVEKVLVRAGDRVRPGQVVFTVAGAEAVESGEGAAGGRRPVGPGERETVVHTREATPAERGAATGGRSEEAQGGADRRAPGGEPSDGKPSPGGAERDTGPRAGAPGDGAPAAAALIPAAPSTRRFARELGLDLAGVRGSGPGGRITLEDVKAEAKARLAAAAAGPPAARIGQESAPTLPDFARWGPVERVPLSGVRRAAAAHLSAAWSAVPHVTHFEKADVTDLEALREAYGLRVAEAGGRLTPTAVLLKVAAAALRRFPHFNSSIDVQAGELILKKYCHIGVAVDTEHGLLVPVIRDVDKKNILELARELAEVAERARSRRLTADEMQGGCFTISNLGGIGGTSFTPIVNAPEVAILGVARARVEPVYRDGAFVPRTLMPLALSYDHRAIDGADAARFLRWVKEALENPFLLALEG